MNELNRLTADQFHQASKLPIVVVLDNVRSLLNVGSIFRTCDAFLVEKLYLCGITGTPPHREIQKTALGSTESVAWQHYEDTLLLVNTLRQSGYTILAVEQTEGSIPLQAYTCQPSTKLALVFGNEIRGVDQAVLDVADVALEIPQFGTKHSLNIAVATGIVVYNMALQCIANN
jgi:tRNA G18 (ribose-2'-O)-methylase SpoU